MILWFRKQASPLLFCMLTFLFLIALGWIVLSFHSIDQPFSIQSPAAFDEDWYREASDGQQISIPSLSQPLVLHEQTVLSCHLPAALSPGSFLIFKNQNLRYRVYLDQTLLDDHTQPRQAPFGNFFGFIWSSISLPVNAAGQELRVELFPGMYGAISEVKLGDMDSLVLSLLCGSLPRLLGCVLLLVLGCSHLLSVLWIRRSVSPNIASTFWLGLFILIAAVWVFSNGAYMQFISVNQAFNYYFSMYSFCLMPPALLMFVREQLPGYRSLLNRCCLSFLVMILIVSILSVCNLLDISGSLIVVHISIILCILLMVILCFLQRKTREARELLVAIVLLSVFSVLSMVFFYMHCLLGISRNDYALLFLAGVFCFCVLLSIQRLRANLRNARQAVMAGYFEQQAYKDALTGLGNFAACDQILSRFDGYDTNRPLSLVMMDLNNLKQINDTLGHNAGNDLLHRAADCLQQAFCKSGECFRIGGDEFLILLPDQSISEAQAAIQRFEAILSRQNENCSIPIDIAYGMASRCKNSGVRPKDLLHAADQKMYTDKRIHKASVRCEAEIES